MFEMMNLSAELYNALKKAERFHLHELETAPRGSYAERGHTKGLRKARAHLNELDNYCDIPARVVSAYLGKGHKAIIGKVLADETAKALELATPSQRGQA